LRDVYERKNLGGFDLIYPCQSATDMALYHKLLEGAREIWESSQNLGLKKKVIDFGRPRPFIVSTAPLKS